MWLNLSVAISANSNLKFPQYQKQRSPLWLYSLLPGVAAKW